MRALGFVFVVLMITSCAPLNYYKSDVTLNEQLADSLNLKSIHKKKIKVGDRLSIGVHGEDDISVGSVFDVYNSNPVYGKWVEVQTDSSIVLPRVGSLIVAGRSKLEVRELLKEKYSAFILDPVIDVKIHSHQMSVLGQVIKPGNYSLTSGGMSLAEAIAEAGGTDFYAKITHVSLVRDSVAYRVDMKNSSAHLLSKIDVVDGDVLVVPTRRTKSIEKSSSVFIATASIATVLILLFDNK